MRLRVATEHSKMTAISRKADIATRGPSPGRHANILLIREAPALGLGKTGLPKNLAGSKNTIEERPQVRCRLAYSHRVKEPLHCPLSVMPTETPRKRMTARKSEQIGLQ
jgi:hypothetical protein